MALHRLPEDIRAGLIGYLAQEPAIFDASIRGNITRLGRNASDTLGDVVEAARLAGVHEAIIRLPAGYDTMLKGNLPQLSGGERKRIALARALYGYPRLVVLDEPEAALDHEGRRQLRSTLRRLRERGSSVVVATQSPRLARMADQVLELGGSRPECVAVPTPPGRISTGLRR